MFKKHDFLIAEKEYAYNSVFTAIVEGIIFKNYNVLNTSYYYDQVNEIGAGASGAILAVGRRYKTVQLIIAKGGATSVEVSIEIKIHPEMPFTQALELSFTSDTSKLITVSENAHEFRVGVKATGTPDASTLASIGFKIQN